jgi:hypothetical protein
METRRIKRLEYNDGSFEFVIDNVVDDSDGHEIVRPFNNVRYNTFEDACSVAFPGQYVKSLKYVIKETIVQEQYV